MEPLALALAGGLGGALVARPAGRLAQGPMPAAGLALAGAAACALAALGSAPGWPAAVNAALALALVVLAAVDWAVLRLPNVLTLPLCAAGLAEGALMHGDLGGRTIGALAGFLSLAAVAAGFRRVAGRSGLGLGDAKLFAAAGAWLGWELLPQVLLIACGFGFAQAAVAVARRGLAALRSPIPFGPALCAALLSARLVFTIA